MGDTKEPSEIAGRYQIGEKLGEGAFGTVCRAKDTVLGRMVAIKTVRLGGLAAAGTQLDELMDRFRREAQVAAQLKHPNIVTIYDIGEDAGLNYIAMEYIEGQALDELIRQSGRLPLERVVAIGVQIAEALDYAHRNSVIHRDIKPANVMLEAEDHVKVTDFGIAKPLDSVEQLTATGSLLGTPAYMSPEQARGQSLDGSSDLFSLGCILYEMVVGARAFQGDSITSLLLKIVTEDPRPIREVAPSLPEPFSDIVTRALRKDRKERYQSGKELAKDLAALGSVTTISEMETLGVSGTSPVQAPLPTTVTAPPTAVPTAVVAAPPPVESAPVASPPTHKPTGEAGRQRSPMPLLLGAVAVLVVAVGALSWLLLFPPAEPTGQERLTQASDHSPAQAPSATADVQDELAEARQALEGLGGLLGQVGELTGEPEDPDTAEALGILQQVLSGGDPEELAGGTEARAGLMVLARAEEAFRVTTGRYGTLEEIGETLTLMGDDLGELRFSGDHAEAGGVRYEVHLTDAGFVAKATPITPGSATLVTDRTGEIRTVQAEQ